MPVKREEIYKAIEEERLYQDSIPTNSKEQDEKTSIGEWLIYIEEILQRAKREIYNLDNSRALCQVRKIIALGVACLEYKGLITRKRENDGTFIKTIE